jgi:hypothetical protein
MRGVEARQAVVGTPLVAKIPLELRANRLAGAKGRPVAFGIGQRIDVHALPDLDRVFVVQQPDMRRH